MLYNTNIMTVTISAFRNNLAEIMEKVKKGKVVEITQRGKVIAKLNPALNEEAWLKHELYLIKRGSKIKGDIISPLDDSEITLDLDNLN